jgi:uncharacterized coiled-coil protein SlyX
VSDPSFAAATTKRISEQERELVQQRLQVAEQAATIRTQQHTIAALREQMTATTLRLQRVQTSLLDRIDERHGD